MPKPVNTNISSRIRITPTTNIAIDHQAAMSMRYRHPNMNAMHATAMSPGTIWPGTVNSMYPQSSAIRIRTTVTGVDVRTSTIFSDHVSLSTVISPRTW